MQLVHECNTDNLCFTDYGNTVFETIKITLVRTTEHGQNVGNTFSPCSVVQVCDDCMKTDRVQAN